MEKHELSKILTAFIACAYKPGLIGIPTLVFAFKFSFLKTFLISSSGGIFGSFVFTFLSEEIIILYVKFLDNFFPKRKKKKFTPFNRFIIKAKHHFGIVGIAAISPILLSIPFGAFLCVRFFEDQKKTILSMSISSVAWTVILYSVYHYFNIRF